MYVPEMWAYVQAYKERACHSEKEKQQLTTRVSPPICHQMSTFDPFSETILAVVPLRSASSGLSACVHRLCHIKSHEELHGGK